MQSVTFKVYGRPQQMGSKKAFVRGNRAILTDDNSVQRRQWANAVATAAAEAMQGAKVIDGPVRVSVMFAFCRPKSHFGSGRNAGKLKSSAPMIHAQTPDLDKLIRCLLDAMTGIVFRDDALVYCIDAMRVWAAAQECASVEVVRMTRRVPDGVCQP